MLKSLTPKRNLMYHWKISTDERQVRLVAITNIDLLTDVVHNIQN